MTVRILAIVAAAVALAARAGAVRAAEIDDLVARVKPPARFEGYKPDWHVEQRTYTFQDYDGPVSVPHWMVMDGDRVVAFMPRDLFHSGCIYVLDFRPGHAPKPDEIPMPTERWHIDTSIGAQLRTDAFIPTAYGKTDASYDWKVDGDRVVLTRRFKGNASYDKWTHRTKGKEFRVDTTTTLALSVDPVLGYVVDTRYDTWTDEPLARFEYASAALSGRHTTWPEDMTCQRMAISSGDRPEGWHGYATNMGCTRQHGGDGLCRDGGFVAFLNDETGWSPTYTNETGSVARLVVCGPHTDHDFTIDMKKVAGETRDGMTRYQTRHRMLAMPPEVTKRVWDGMTLLHADEHQVLLRMGRVDDFEDQPLCLGGRERGHPIGGEVTEEAAHSGKRSLRIQKTTGVGSPTLCVRPGRRYRLEAWLKAEPWTDEQRATEEAARRERVERAREAAEKARAQGKEPRPVPELEPLGPARALITCQYQEWPGGRTQGDPMATEAVEPGAGWRHVAIDFTAPAWGPALDIRFVAEQCTVYVDDFRLGVVEEGK